MHLPPHLLARLITKILAAAGVYLDLYEQGSIPYTVNCMYVELSMSNLAFVAASKHERNSGF